eukprot:167980_1
MWYDGMFTNFWIVKKQYSDKKLLFSYKLLFNYKLLFSYKLLNYIWTNHKLGFGTKFCIALITKHILFQTDSSSAPIFLLHAKTSKCVCKSFADIPRIELKSLRIKAHNPSMVFIK